MTAAQPNSEPDGVALRDGEHVVRLKWHRMKRRSSDIPFTPSILALALELGASSEIDIRLHGEGGFAVIHDETLDRETTGTGPVREATVAYLRTLHLRAPDGTPTQERLLLLDELVSLAAGTCDPAALVQLDLKEAMPAIDADIAERFAATIATAAGRFLVSGHDFEAVRALRAGTPDLAVGFDPCEDGIAERLADKSAFEAFVADAIDRAPEASTIYLDYELILRAATLGYDLVDPFHQAGRLIDAYTLNTTHRHALGSLKTLVALKVDQITTDEPIVLERLFEASRGVDGA